jgi:diguanylate cyclase (GGDEF)-like protein
VQHRPFFLPLPSALRCLLMALWMLGTSAAFASDGTPGAHGGRVLDATLASSTSPTPLTPWFDVLEDPGGTLRFDAVRSPALADRFTPSDQTGEALNHGITPSAWWLRLQLHNPSDAALARVLEVAYARLSHLDFYAQQSDGSWKQLHTGTTQPFESRGYAHRHFVFDVALPPRSTQTLYLRIASTTAFIVPAQLWEPAAFRAHERSDYAAQAWYFGMAAAMVLFNLLLFLRLKDWLHLQYVGFTLSIAFALAAQNGLVKEVFRLTSPLWSDLCTTFGYSFALASGMLFLRSMVQAPSLLPRLDPWLRGFIAFFLVSPLLFLVTGQTLIKAAAVVYLLAMVSMMAVAIYSAWRRQRSAYFFLAAFGLLALGAMTNALRAMGLLPTTTFTANAMQIGSALEMLLLALALADRFHQMRREKNAMQVELLAAQKNLIDTLQSNEQRLEAHVAERTLALEAANHRLEALSRTDGLTGIANRRKFDEVLANEWARSQRSGAPLALAMIDIDWFKAYNDQCGHLGGDDCLRHVAGVLAGCAVRSTDLVARYGGEEFAILCPGSTAEQMQALAAHIQQALAKLALPHPGTPNGRVTLCIGIAAQTALVGNTADALVAAADQALYRAKALGRNQIELAQVDVMQKPPEVHVNHGSEAIK